MPRYVILEHDHPFLHWDLMLESGDILRTWRLTQPPQPAINVAATSIVDHRLIYLDYEGLVSGNRGRVVCWDHGTFSWQQVRSNLVAVKLTGARLRGGLNLEQIGADQWVLRYGPE